MKQKMFISAKLITFLFLKYIKLFRVIDELGVNDRSKIIFVEAFRIFELGSANDFPALKARLLDYVNGRILAFFPYLTPEIEPWFGIMCNFLIGNTTNVRTKVRTISFFSKTMQKVLFYM